MNNLFFCLLDAEVIMVGGIKKILLEKNEKRSFILRVTSAQRKVNLNLVPLRGRINLVRIEKQKWKIPFDTTMQFDRNHSVRESLNIKGKQSVKIM